jgi:hypothetical protein
MPTSAPCSPRHPTPDKPGAEGTHMRFGSVFIAAHKLNRRLLRRASERAERCSRFAAGPRVTHGQAASPSRAAPAHRRPATTPRQARQSRIVARRRTPSHSQEILHKLGRVEHSGERVFKLGPAYTVSAGGRSGAMGGSPKQRRRENDGQVLQRHLVDRYVRHNLLQLRSARARWLTICGQWACWAGPHTHQPC